ncbi:MAG: CHAT domain-containing protein [Geitlerinemataceae cyanobacterium]
MHLLLLLGSTLAFSLLSADVLATNVTSEASVETQVDRVDGQFDIRGGELSGDGENLFQSFEAFGLEANQVANFITPANVRNVLGRVTGGGASRIDGSIVVTGSSADLFLMNPAGIVFGENARLDVAGDFTATTASGIEFEDGWFNSAGVANWTALVGAPIALDFSGAAAGAIANFGELSVDRDANLNLFGGTVLNVGELSGGGVSVTAANGGSTLHIAAAGNVLSLEVMADRIGESRIEPIALPELLAGGEVTAASSLEIVNGVVRLAGAVVAAGDSVVTGALDVSGDSGGTAQVLGDRVMLAGANIDASGASGGGAIYLGGEYRGGGTLPTAEFTEIDAGSSLDASALQTGDGGEVIVWAEDTAVFLGEIAARGGALGGDGGLVETSGRGALAFGGGVDVGAAIGRAGSVLLDPENVTISDAPAAISGGNETVNAASLEAITGEVTVEATNDITLETDLNFSRGTGRIEFIADSDGVDGGSFVGYDGVTAHDIVAPGRNVSISGSSVTVGNIRTARLQLLSGPAGDVSIISHDGGIQTGAISADTYCFGLFSSCTAGDGGSIGLTSNGTIRTGQLYTRAACRGDGCVAGDGGSITIEGSGDISIESITALSLCDEDGCSSGDGGNVRLDSAGGEIFVDGNENARAIRTYAECDGSGCNAGNGGTLEIESGAGTTIGGSIETHTSGDLGCEDCAFGEGGSVEITSDGDLTTAKIETDSVGGSRAGDIARDSEGSMTIGRIEAESHSLVGASRGGNVSLDSRSNIQTQQIDAGASGRFGFVSQGGGISLTGGGSISTGSLLANAGQNGNGGNVFLESSDGQGITVNGFVTTYSLGEINSAGNVTIYSAGGLRITGPVIALGVNDGGRVDLRAAGDVYLDSGIDAFGVVGASEPVSIGAYDGDRPDTIRVQGIDNLSRRGSTRGGITLRAESDITIPGVLQSGSFFGTTRGNISVQHDRGTSSINALRSTAVGAQTLVQLADHYDREARAALAAAGRPSSAVESALTEHISSVIDDLGGDDSSTYQLIYSYNSLANALRDISDPVEVPEADSGIIEITTPDGSIDINTLITEATSGETGNITLEAGSIIRVNTVTSSGGTNNGTIYLTGSALVLNEVISTNGSGNTTGAVRLEATEGMVMANVIDASSTSGDGGNLEVIAVSDISIDVIQTQADGLAAASAGGVDITSTGNIDIGDADSYATNGSGSNINLTGDSGVTTSGTIRSYGRTASGNLNITSSNSDVSTQQVVTQSGVGPSGNIAIGGQNVATGNVSSIASTGSGNIDITATDGGVTTQNITTATNTNNAGSAIVTATGNITTGNIVSSTDGDGDSGNVTVASEAGSITSGDVTTESASGSSGNVDFSALLDAALGDVSTSGGANSGDVNISAGRDVTAGDITSQAQTGNSGDLSLNAGRDITTGDIASIAPEGTSGDIDLNAGRDATTGNITTPDGTIAIDAGRDITTGELISDGDIFLNGEVLGAEDAAAPGSADSGEGRGNRQADSFPQLASSLDPNVTINTNSNSASSTGMSSSPDADDGGQNDAGFSGLFLPNNLLASPLTFVETNPIDLAELDAERSDEYTRQLGEDPDFDGSIEATREAMSQVEAATGVRTGAVYVSVRDGALDIALLSNEDAPVTVTVKVERSVLEREVRRYVTSLTGSMERQTQVHQIYGARLYDWLIRPILPEIEARGLDTLMFSMDAGLRGVPIAALYDGDRYLIEDYSLSLIPSIGLIDTRYRPIDERATVLAAGASEFTDGDPLPAVPFELEVLVNHRREGEIFLNEKFTRDNIVTEQAQNPYPIVHLATHAEFSASGPQDSYIQLWDEKVGLDDIRELGWHEPAVELLVLSACQTALGSDVAEMGFAGFAVAAGVKTAIASLWSVDDAATFMLMTELYDHLASARVKAEALREAQLAMIRGDVRIESGMLYAEGVEEPIPLPADLSRAASGDFSHPYFWSAFTTIGAPW